MKTKKRIILVFLAVMLCMAAFSGTALAVPEDDAPAESAEPETEVPEETEEEVSFEDFFSGLGELFGSFTPEGNLTLVDDFSIPAISEDGTRSVKQFITVQSKNGNTFYIVIDRAGDRENVYFLNLVDESDLLALMEEEPKADDPAPLICTCKEKCSVGHIDTSCPVCAVNVSECAGKETKAEPGGSQGAASVPAETAQDKTTVYILLAVVLTALIGGIALYFVRSRGMKKGAVRRSSPEPDEDDEELYFPPEEEEQEEEK